LRNLRNKGMAFKASSLPLVKMPKNITSLLDDYIIYGDIPILIKCLLVYTIGHRA
jgi:hypothetical protein